MKQTKYNGYKPKLLMHGDKVLWSAEEEKGGFKCDWVVGLVLMAIIVLVVVS